MMDFAGPGSWRWTLACLLGLSSLITAQSQCVGDKTVGGPLDGSDAFFTCTTYNGTVTFQNITAEGGTTPQIYWPNLVTLQGSLIFENLFETSEECLFDFAHLQTVSGQLSFNNLNNVTMPAFPGLQSIDGFVFNNVTFSIADGAPQGFGYQSLAFSTGGSDHQFPVLSWVRSLSFTGCRNLPRIGDYAKFGPSFEAIEATGSPTISVVQNEDLTSLYLYGYANIHTNLIVQDNNRELEIDTDITDAFLQINHVAKLTADSLESLTTSDANGFSGAQSINDNFFANLSLPALTTIQNTEVQIDDNMYLSNLSLPILQSVSGLDISDNTLLRNVDLGSVTQVDNLEISGPVNNITLTGLTSANQITGQVIIEPDNQSVCQSIALPDGSYKCGPNLQTQKPSQSTQTGEPGRSSQRSSGLSQDAKIGIGVGVGVGGLLIIGAIIFICCARRRKQRQRINPRSAGADEYYMEPKNHERAPARYTKVAHSSSVDHGSADHSSEDRVSPSSHFAESNIGETRFGESRFGENWSPPEQRVPNPDGRVELEEQQGMRHEMDARSLQDMDLDDDREETRSLEDIERAHGQT